MHLSEGRVLRRRQCRSTRQLLPCPWPLTDKQCRAAQQLRQRQQLQRCQPCGLLVPAGLHSQVPSGPAADLRPELAGPCCCIPHGKQPAGQRWLQHQRHQQHLQAATCQQREQHLQFATC